MSAQPTECADASLPPHHLRDAQSSDEEFQDFDYDENAYDSDLYIEDEGEQAQQQDQAQARAGSSAGANRPVEPAPIRRYQAPPAPLGADDDSDDDENDRNYAPGGFGGGYASAAGGRAMPGLSRFLNPAAFQPGFGGHAFAKPPASAFRRQYRAYSTAILEVQQGRSYGGGRSNLMFGGKSAWWRFVPLSLLRHKADDVCTAPASRHAAVRARRD